MSGIGIILNPHSRSNRKNPERVKQLGFIVGDKGSCHATETLDQVRRVAYEFKDRGIEILGISGGDGTNHKTLTAFLDVYGDAPLPKIALLRGGTMNNMANQLGIRGTPEKVLSNLIFKYHENEPFAETRINMIRVNGMYGFLFGMGLISRFIEKYQDVEGGPSPARGAWMLARAMFSSLFNGRMVQHLAERFDATITVDGRRMPFKNYMMIFAGTMRTLGFNFRPLYRATSAEGQFQTVAISATGRQVLCTFPAAFLARPSKSEHYADEMGSRVVIELEKPMSYTIDGDFPESPSDRIEISTGPLLTCIVN
ncbi:MAG TPA: diacylglycerol kinase family protein [bacterium]|nr:diacylglycerol kinase family protein [bacterium]